MISNKVLIQSISQTSKQLQSKEFSATELANAALALAEKSNSKTNAYITISNSKALEVAKAADKRIASDSFNILTGIPFCLKDAYITHGIPSTSASNVLKDYTPQYNATVYQSLLDSFAVPIGKNNQDAWGHGASSENTDFGKVNNPWDTNRTAGGSSGGTAAAVASGGAMFAIGEDTGGSIRNPCSFCNVTGLKVTYGRVSRYGAIAYASSLDTVGPMARSAEDIAYVLTTIAGFDPHDASSSHQRVENYSNNLNKSIKGKKIGILKEFISSELDPQIRLVVSKALEDLESQGCEIVEISIPSAKLAVSAYYVIALSETSSNLARYDGTRYGNSRDNFTPETIRRILLGTFSLSTGYYDAYYKNALRARTLLIQEFNKAFDQADAILAPVSPFIPYEFSQVDIASNPEAAMFLADLYTGITNIVGIPSLALPAGFSSEGLPIGLQLMGPMFAESVLLNIGHQYQQNTNWHQQLPPIMKDLL